VRLKLGFTIIELIIVILILSVIAVAVAPKFLSVSKDAKVAALKAIAKQINSTNTLVRSKARVLGLKAAQANPAGAGGNSQTAYIIDFEFGSTEVNWSSLCPEAQAEDGDALQFFDFMEIDTSNLSTSTDNQYAAVGFDIPDAGAPTKLGCYVFYDSFSQSCHVEVIDTDC